MNSWEPVTRENSLIRGERPAVQEWLKLNWSTASVPRNTDPQIKLTTSENRWRWLVADRAALGLGEVGGVFPVKLPNFYGVPALTPHGWIWMLANTEFHQGGAVVRKDEGEVPARHKG
jgi:hypothetical protein